MMVTRVAVLAVLAACSGRADPPARGAAAPTADLRVAPSPARPDARVTPAPDAPLPEGARARFGGTRLRDAYELSSFAVSRDHRLIATGAAGAYSVRLWDAASGAASYAVKEARSPFDVGGYWTITALAFAGDAVLAARGDNRIIQMSTRDGTVGALAECNSARIGNVTSLAVSRRGDRFAYDCGGSLVAQSIDGTGRVVLAELPWANSSFEAIAWSPDDAGLAALDGDKLVFVEASAKVVRRRDRDANRTVETFAFTTPGQAVVIEDDQVYRYDVAADRDTPLAPTCGPGSRGAAKLAQVSSDARRLVYEAWCDGHDAPQLVVIDLVTGARRELRGPQRSLIGLAFADDAGTELWLAHDHSARRWSVAEDREVLGPPGHHSGITALAYAPDGRTLVSGGRDGELVTWDIATAAPRFRPLPTGIASDGAEIGDDARALRPGQIEQIGWSADRAQMYTTDSGRAGGVWRVWPGDAGAASRATVTHRLRVRGLVPAGGDVMLAIGANVGGYATMHRFSVSSGSEVSYASSPELRTPVYALSPDRSTIAAIGERRVVLVDPASLATRGSIPYEDADRVHALAWSPDGTLFAIAGVNGVDLYRITRNRAVHLHEIATRGGVANTIAFTADRRLIVGGWVGTVELVDLDALDHMHVASSPHVGGVRAIALAPDGATFATAGDDGQILVWPLPARTTR